MKNLFILLLASLIFTNLYADDINEKKKKLIKDQLLYNSSQGREFWIAVPMNDIPTQPDPVMEIYVTSVKNTLVTLESPGLGVYITKNVDSMQITTFSSVNNELGLIWEIRQSEEVLDKGIRISSKDPISVYFLNGKRVSSEGYLALPVSSWGKDYIHNSYYDYHLNDTRPWAAGFVVVAAEDNTKMNILLKGRGKGYAKTQGGHDFGDRLTPKLNRGQVYMVCGDGETRGVFDLSGSSIKSDKPVGLLSFHQRATIPSWDMTLGYDHFIEMMPPVTAWGKKYVTVEYKRDSDKGDFFRIVASQEDTRWKCTYYDKNTGEILGNYGGKLNNPGDFAEYLEIYATPGSPGIQSIRGTSVWEADKPVLVMQYCYSHKWDLNTLFDPFMILVVPEEQFTKATVFQTPSNKEYLNNWFNIVAKHDTNDTEFNDLKSIKLDGRAIHSIESSFLYNKIPTTDMYWAKIQVERGAHRITGDAMFAGYIYGFTRVDSYGWPAAMQVNNLEETDTLEPELEITEDCGLYEVKATEIRNGKEGDNPRQIDQGIDEVLLLQGSDNYRLKFIDSLIAWPPLYEFNFRLEVINPMLKAYALYAVVDRVGNVNIDSAIYTPDSLSILPDQIAFGRVRLRTNKEIDFDVINNSTQITTITSINLKIGSFYEITAGMISGDLVLGPKESHNLKIKYTPVDEKFEKDPPDIDSIIIKTICNKFTWPISGKGVIPRIKVTDWDAGSVIINTSKCKYEYTGLGLKIENTGSDTLVITDISGISTPFYMSDTIPELPIVIPHESKPVYLREMCFNPDEKQDYGIDVLFKSNSDFESADSISRWIGKGISSGPLITDMNWFERRVGSRNNGEVFITNEGNIPIKVLSIGLENSNVNFEIDFANITPKLPILIYPVDSVDKVNKITIPVRYIPSDEDIHSEKIIPVFDDPNTEPGSIYGKLDGIGILPKIVVAGDTLLPEWLINTEHKDTAKIIISSVSNSSKLHIWSIDFSSTSQNPSDFEWPSGYIPPSDFDIEIGESIEIPVIFTPNATGERVTTIEVISDAIPWNNEKMEISAFANVVGYGFDIGLEMNPLAFEPRVYCDQPIDSIRIKNTSRTNNLLLKSIEISDDFSIINYPSRLSTNEQGYIKVLYSPKVSGNHSSFCVIDFEFEGSGISGKDSVLVSGSTYKVDVNLELSNLEDMAPGMLTVNPPYKDFNLSINSSDFNSAFITSFVIELSYNDKELLWQGEDNSNLAKGSILDNTWQVRGKQYYDPATGKSKLLISGNGDTPINKSGVLVKLDLFIALSDTNLYLVDIDNASFEGRDICIDLITKRGSILLNTCVNDLRSVVFSGEEYQLFEIQPNPINTNNFELKYNIGLKGLTRIELLNSSGELIKTINESFENPGRKELKVDVTDLSSGLYFIRLHSGVFFGSTRFIISK